MLGLSTRKYGRAVREFAEAYGLEKSAISEHFTEASRAKLKDMMERRLDKVRLCALLIDATPFAGQQMVAALGISQGRAEDDLGRSARSHGKRDGGGGAAGRADESRSGLRRAAAVCPRTEARHVMQRAIPGVSMISIHNSTERSSGETLASLHFLSILHV